MNHIDSEKSYSKYKYAVKKWEKEFKCKNHRVPSKLDIKEAPAKVRYAYKKYYEFKTNVLENTLCELDFEDEIAACSPDFLILDVEPPENDDISGFPSSEQLSEMLSSIDKKKTITEESNEKDVQKLSQKLFQRSKFNIRNPRKSQSFMKDKSSADISADIQNGSFSNTISESVNEILVDKNCPEDQLSSLPSLEYSFNLTFDGKAQNSVRKLDDKWVSRALQEPNRVTCSDSKFEDEISLKQKINQCPKKSRNFGMSNVLIPSPIKVVNDIVENSDSDAENLSSMDERILKPKSKRLKMWSEKTAPSPREECSSEPNNAPPILENFVHITSVEELKNIKPRQNNLSQINFKSLSSSTAKSECAIEGKIQNGTLNENFVKINVNKKVFVRGKKSFNFSKFKKNNFKIKSATNQMEFPANGKIVCFKCNGTGHFSRYCTAHKGEGLLPAETSEECDLPTLEQMSEEWNDSIEISSTPNAHDSSTPLSQYKPSVVPTEFLKMLNDVTNSNTKESIKPLYSFKECGEKTPSEVKDALKLFGHESFRPGQENAIMRILSGLSTLLILSTGSGKSLIYQLPAFLYSKNYKCITLVISPLVSLMEDQVIGMPDFLKAGCLHSNQTKSQNDKIIDLLKNGDINILLISPETLTSAEKSTGFGGVLKFLPPIAFACIDEVHCVSQWSHNFRPSYLMVCKALREKLKVNCILGLTATASQPTITSIIEHIGIQDGNKGVITNPMLPDNLHLSASFEKDKDRALIHLLSSDLFFTYNSIIIYCLRRDDCERVAGVLRSLLQEPGKQSTIKNNKRKRTSSCIAEAYHAGLSAAKRRRIQDQFMSGSLRIIVATIAFGMGINKPDIRGIIHYSMPSSFESYVQEIGRAGRDGQTAHCHVFLNKNCNDKDEHLKHIHANSIDRSVIRKLLQKVFLPCNCTQETEENASQKNCSSHEIAFPIDDTVEELDLPAETISTLLCYLELHPKKYIQVLNNCYINCKMFSYGGFKQFEELAKKSLPLSLVLKGKNKAEKTNILDFSVIDIASLIGWESGMTKYHLKNLEWHNDGTEIRKSSIKVEFHTLGFHAKSPGNLASSELDEILNFLHTSVQAQEKTRLYQLEEIFACLGDLCFASVYELCSCEKDGYEEKSSNLKQNICSYFQRTSIINDDTTLIERPLDESRAVSDIRALISTYKDCRFSGRAIARILQGISSPNYPAVVWGRCKYWRTHIHEDFNGLVRLATQQIIDMR